MKKKKDVRSKLQFFSQTEHFEVNFLPFHLLKHLPLSMILQIKLPRKKTVQYFMYNLVIIESAATVNSKWQ